MAMWCDAMSQRHNKPDSERRKNSLGVQPLNSVVHLKEKRQPQTIRTRYESKT